MLVEVTCVTDFAQQDGYVVLGVRSVTFRNQLRRMRDNLRSIDVTVARFLNES